MYFGKKSSSGTTSSIGVTTFFTGETVNNNPMQNSNSDCCYMTSSGGTANVKSLSNDQNVRSYKLMPMSVKSAEEQLSVLASFMALYENYIPRKIDLAVVDKDYYQIDPDDLDEMDIQWKLAMISRRAKRFMNRI